MKYRHVRAISGRGEGADRFADRPAEAVRQPDRLRGQRSHGIQDSADRFGELRRIYMLLQRDLEQIVPRAVRGEYGEVLPALCETLL